MFKMGTIVRFNPKNSNRDWDALSQQEKQQLLRRYRDLMNGSVWDHFIFITEIVQAPGHCVLINQRNGKVSIMRHTKDFIVVPDDEC